LRRSSSLPLPSTGTSSSCGGEGGSEMNFTTSSCSTQHAVGEWHLGQKGADCASKWAGSADLGRPAWAHFGPVHGLLRPALVPESSRSFPLLHVGPRRQFLFELDEAPCLARFCTFLLGPRSLSSSWVWSLGFLESSWLHCMTCTGLQGLVTRCLMNLPQKSCFQR
jgi:hypothetical protein